MLSLTEIRKKETKNSKKLFN